MTLLIRSICLCLIAWLLASAALAPVHAAMRCNQQVIQEGDLTVDVRRKCGEPVSREVFPPAVDAYGQRVPGAATTEIWVYGPAHGVYRYLRFIDGTLVRTWIERD